MGNKKQIGTLLATFMALALGACAKENPIYCGDDKPCPTGLYCSTEHICAAGFSLDETGYYFDGKTYWSAISAPVLTGTTNIPSPIIEVYAGDVLVAGPATVDGDTWSLPLPEGALKDNTPTELRVVQTDEDQRHVEITRSFAGDLTPPTAEFIPTDSLDESKDTVEFEGDGTPRHTHEQYKITLDGKDNRELPRYQHLLRVGSPYARENTPNPAMWQIALNTRVAFDKAATRYRIIGAEGPIVDWAPIVPVAQQSGGYQFSVPINLETAAVFGDKSGTYTIEFEVTDWAKRQVKQSATWSIKLLPPPLQVGPMTTTTTGPNALANMRIGRTQLEQYINGQKPTALYERTVSNGSEFPVDVKFTVVSANRVAAEATLTTLTSSNMLGDVPCEWINGTPRMLAAFKSFVSGPGGGREDNDCTVPFDSVTKTSDAALPWRVVLRDETDAEVEVCAATEEASTFRCRIPPRNNETPTRLRAVAEVNNLSLLNPAESNLTYLTPILPPAHQNGVKVGLFVAEYKGCEQPRLRGDGIRAYQSYDCNGATQRYRVFQVLSSASLTVSSPPFGLGTRTQRPSLAINVSVPGEPFAPQASGISNGASFGAFVWNGTAP